MKLFQLTLALWAMNGALAPAEDASAVSGTPAPTVASMTSSGTLATAPLPEHRRTFVLLLGIGAVAITFHHGLGSRKQQPS